MRGRRAITHTVRDARRHRVVRLAQRAYCGGRYGNTPVTAGIRNGGVVNAIQGHGDRGAFWLVAGPGKQQVFAFFGGVNHVVRRQSVNTYLRRHGINHHLQRAAAGVARLIGHRDRNRPGSVRQALYHRRRQAEAPVARRIHHGGVIHVIDGHRDPITRCRSGHGAAEDLRLGMGKLVNGIGIGDKIVNSHLRYGGIHQPDAISAAVTCHIAHGCRYRDGAIGQCADVRSRYCQLPATVMLNGGLVGFTVQRDGDRLARFRRAATA